MESVGARLKKIRLEKGISLEEVQKKTKIHSSVLRAMEEDSLANFSPVYIKGFLKLYCNFLGVNAKDFIADYKEPQQKVAITATAAKSIPFKLSRKNIKTVFIIVLALAFIIGLFNLGKRISSKAVRSLPRRTRAGLTAKPQAMPQKTQKTTAVTPKAKPKAGFSETSQLIRLGIRAREESYIHLKVDGRTMFQGILKRGRYEVWEALKKIELSIGNAGGVELELNGQPVSNLGRRNQAIKNIIITKEQGLVIPR